MRAKLRIANVFFKFKLMSFFVLNISAASVPVHVHVHVHRETYAVRATEILPCVVPHTYDALLQISRIFRHFTSKQMPCNIQDLE